MARRRLSLRRTVELAIFVAAALPATVVLGFGLIELRGAGDGGIRAIALTGLVILVMLAAGGFAIVVGSSITRDLQRLHGISTLLARSALRRGVSLSTPHAVMQYPETQSVLATLAALAKHVEESREHDAELAAFVAHDMRTPLGALAISLEQMQAKNHASWIEGQRMEVRRLLRDLDVLVNALRGTDSVDGQTRRPAGSASVEDAVRQTVARIETTTDASIEVVVHRDHRVGLDADQLLRVVENLVMNAVRYGSGQVRVEVGAGYLRVENDVHSGGGVGAGAARQTSHGLGQAIVRRWVEGLGGKFVIQSSDRRYIVDVILPTASLSS